ncbi:MAG TPA: hypothetical protein DCK93_09825 [Blastocatellia bacterium]|nr:hypothetical protein [Blastocatellia bacterium]
MFKSPFLAITTYRFHLSLESGEPDLLPGGVYVFPVYHCGAYVLNTHRKLPARIQGWKRIGNCLLRLFVEELDAAERDGGSVGRVSGASTGI